ncbi:MAG: tRNA (N6-isopentenyl adenosine(37)-C2)-methylthiotransferase MiaB [Clostridia bacterium]
MYYFIATYGCQMNVHESEKIAGVLEELGYCACTRAIDADIVVFNTCAIRESAETKILGNIGALKPIKAIKKDLIIVLCGCMTQQEGMSASIHKKFPFVDIIIGTHNLASLKDFIIQRQNEKKFITETLNSCDIAGRDNMKVTRTSGYNAWVNIMYGCNNFCSYCIVPYVRGREVSRPIDDIINEIKDLLKQGYCQITLLGQNVNSYGNDLGGLVNFAMLLRKIDEISGKFRIRFMTSHPKDLSSEVIDVIASSSKICHYIHLPVQSGSNKILELMNRKYTREKYLKTITEIKSKIPDVQFSSDIIVGFPTETEEDFNDTLRLIEEVKYEQLFVFMYSKRKGTIAEKMDGQVELAEKKRRISVLLEKQNQIATGISESYIGTILEVLVDDVSPKNDKILLGSTFAGKTISFYGDKRLVGKFIYVKIIKAKHTTLFGEIVEE